MATIYSWSGDNSIITDGLQSGRVSDEAIQAASRIAEERGEPVALEDRDMDIFWLVHPDGTYEDIIERPDDAWVTASTKRKAELDQHAVRKLTLWIESKQPHA